MKHFLVMEAEDGSISTFDGYLDSWEEACTVVDSFVQMMKAAPDLDSNAQYRVEALDSSAAFLIYTDDEVTHVITMGVIPEVKLPTHSVSWTGFDYANFRRE